LSIPACYRPHYSRQDHRANRSCAGRNHLTTGIGTITIEVTISGATSPTLKMIIEESASQAEYGDRVDGRLKRYAALQHNSTCSVAWRTTWATAP
jgi:hypothetical protein